MRTKTLLIAAAALVAGIVSSEAQVYSANVVGYVSVTCPPGKFTLLANQLDTGSNTLNNVLSSVPVGGGKITASLWTGSGFSSYSYYTTADGAPANGWYDAGFNLSTNNFPVATAVFIRNTVTTNVSLTLVGTVTQGTNTYVVKPGFSFFAEPVPLAGTSLDSASVTFPATLNDTYTPWTGTSYGAQLTYYTTAFGAPQNGWYDSGFTLQSTNSAPWPGVGQGFLINHSGGTSNWVNSFTVQ
jgi:hypothetical protein